MYICTKKQENDHLPYHCNRYYCPRGSYYSVVHQPFEGLARGYAKEAKLFHERLLQLTDPSHHFTDEELHKLKRDFAPLLYSVNELYNNPFITNEYLDKIGLGDFLEERKLVNHQQYLNNIRQSPQS